MCARAGGQACARGGVGGRACVCTEGASLQSVISKAAPDSFLLLMVKVSFGSGVDQAESLAHLTIECFFLCVFLAEAGLVLGVIVVAALVVMFVSFVVLFLLFVSLVIQLGGVRHEPARKRGLVEKIEGQGRGGWTCVGQSRLCASRLKDSKLWKEPTAPDTCCTNPTLEVLPANQRE